MNGILDYVSFERMDQFEFCFLLTQTAEVPAIQLVVIDHEEYRVRGLSTASSLEDAFNAAENCIQRGFYQDGLLFTGIPTYSLSL